MFFIDLGQMHLNESTGTVHKEVSIQAHVAESPKRQITVPC